MDWALFTPILTEFGIPGAVVSAAFFFLLTGRVVPKSIVDGYKEEIKELKRLIEVYQKRGDILYDSGRVMAEKSIEVNTKMLNTLPDLDKDLKANENGGE